MDNQKYHINELEEVKPCRAIKGKCPFGGETGQDNHFSSKKEAEKVRDDKMAEIYGHLTRFQIIKGTLVIVTKTMLGFKDSNVPYFRKDKVEEYKRKIPN